MQAFAAMPFKSDLFTDTVFALNRPSANDENDTARPDGRTAMTGHVIAAAI
jgi:hypothetical protein